MNTVHLHLLLNHLPVVGTIIAVVLLAYALARRSDELVRTGFGMLVVLALVAGAVYLTGEPAEEAVEGLADVSEARIERHEEAALTATILLGAVGVVALGGLLTLRGDAARTRRVGRLVLVLALVPTAAMGYAAYLGGQIRHSEIRPGAVPVESESGPVTEGGGATSGERG